jgi:hypothetical protein
MSTTPTTSATINPPVVAGDQSGAATLGNPCRHSRGRFADEVRTIGAPELLSVVSPRGLEGLTFRQFQTATPTAA